MQKGRTKQKFTGKIINSKDFVVCIFGDLYFEKKKNGHTHIDMKIYEKKKVKGEEGEQTELVAVVELELDKDNHVIYTEVTDVITDGKSVTKHNKNEGGANHSLSYRRALFKFKIFD